jgi:hypothetical protein
MSKRKHEDDGTPRTLPSTIQIDKNCEMLSSQLTNPCDIEDNSTSDDN